MHFTHPLKSVANLYSPWLYVLFLRKNNNKKDAPVGYKPFTRPVSEYKKYKLLLSLERETAQNYFLHG